MESGIPIARLLETWSQIEESLPAKHPFGLRMRRATSWLQRASNEQDDPDAAFIFCWIAFNAAYGDERVEREHELFNSYFSRILALEHGRTIHRAVWQRFPNPIKAFVANQYVYWRFWEFQDEVDGAGDWVDRLEWDVKRVDGAIARQRTNETSAVLKVLFSRLYVLRNQLLHGGATWKSSVNRDQVWDGARIMFFLVPIFVDVMLSNPNEDWGNPRFPVVYDQA